MKNTQFKQTKMITKKIFNFLFCFLDIIYSRRYRLYLIARVAQLVEQRTENPRVGGSNPPPGTTFLKN